MTDEISHSDSFAARAEGDYGRVRRRAWFRDVVARLAGRSNQSLSYEAVRRSLKLGGPIYRGVKTVPVAQIVGSVDRYRDVDDVFLPKQDSTANRWKSIARAFYNDVDLPPVRLYKVGSAYFVMDGHHRVSVAREQGIEFIDAEVQEAISRVPVSANLKAEDLKILHEYRRFQQRPAQVHAGNLEIRRDFLDVRDAVRAYWMAATLGKPGEVYNVASGRARSIREILDSLCRLSELKNVAVVFDAARLRPADIPRLCGAPGRFRLTTGWEPAVPFEQTLHDTLMYWRSRVRGS